MKRTLHISILVDNPRSWYVPYADQLASRLRELGHIVDRVDDSEKIEKGEVAFYLSCEKLVPKTIRDRNAHNIVMHGSRVPKGKGWSPLTWSVLEGKSEITVSLFEAQDAVDSGNVYLRKVFQLEGHELIEEIRRKEALTMEEMAISFINAYPPGEGEIQVGEESFYSRRKPADSELDPEKSIAENFDLLRIADNERYPAFFRHKGHTYVLRISKKA